MQRWLTRRGSKQETLMKNQIVEIQGIFWYILFLNLLLDLKESLIVWMMITLIIKLLLSFANNVIPSDNWFLFVNNAQLLWLLVHKIDLLGLESSHCISTKFILLGTFRHKKVIQTATKVLMENLLTFILLEVLLELRYAAIRCLNLAWISCKNIVDISNQIISSVSFLEHSLSL